MQKQRKNRILEAIHGWLPAAVVSVMAAAASVATSCQESDFTLSDDSSTPYEADIRYVRIDNSEILKLKGDTLFAVYDEHPEIQVNISADMKSLAPHFVLTKGAQIYMQDESGEWTIPADGVARDFSEAGQSYMVVSQNGKSHRIYTLAFNCQELATEYHFEHFELNDSTLGDDGSLSKKVPHYYVWKEKDSDGKELLTWATANGGFGISKGQNAPTDYPTSPCDGVNGGKGVQLKTMSTGGVAAMMGMRIAAGNLFLGSFNVTTALSNARASTHFGVPFNKKPLQFRGWMCYEPGEQYQDSLGHAVSGVADSCDVYAVLYKNVEPDGKDVMLDGNTVGDSPYIVAKAKIDGSLAAGTNGEWKYFTVDFDYDSYGRPVDPVLISNYGYNLAIVASSSNQGAHFRGAIGSTLKVDELEIIYEK